MATLTRHPNGDVIFNVDHSVGKHGRNRLTDVQLVQYLLNRMISDVHSSGFGLSSARVPESLEVDGICGEKTIAAILWFQKGRNDGPPNGIKFVAEDATINHAGNTMYGPGPKKFYTMWDLNLALSVRKALPAPEDIMIEPLRAELDKASAKGLAPALV
jgi:hypothetical protein